MRRLLRMALQVAAVMPFAMVAAPVGAGTASANAAGATGARAHYRVIDLGILGDPGLGESAGFARAVNDHGDVVGISSTASGGPHPFLWHAGKLTDLGALEPGEWGSGGATDINNRGEIVGSSHVGNSDHAFLWRDGVFTDLGTLGGAFSSALAINDRGQIVGYSITADFQMHAFQWENGHMTDLGPGAAAGINNRGQIVGGTSFPSGYRSFLMCRGVVTDLGTLPGDDYSEANAINNAGWIVGQSRNGVLSTRAYLWRAGTMEELPGLKGANASLTTALNDRGQVIGYSYRQGEILPVLWQHGAPVDLTADIYVGPTGGQVRDVSGINNLGQMAGMYVTAGGGPRPALFVQF